LIQLEGRGEVKINSKNGVVEYRVENFESLIRDLRSVSQQLFSIVEVRVVLAILVLGLLGKRLESLIELFSEFVTSPEFLGEVSDFDILLNLLFRTA
jgi:hypothetical protein